MPSLSPSYRKRFKEANTMPSYILVSIDYINVFVVVTAAVFVTFSTP